jgi:preprotein translocase subunit SecG
MHTVLVVVQVLLAVGLIGLVLIQHGKGADAGAAFGSGASGTVFGARGAANFLSRTTAWLAAAFFAVSLALAYLVGGQSASKSVIDSAPTAAAPAAAPKTDAPSVVTDEPKAPPAAAAPAAPAPAAPAPTAPQPTP